MKDLLKKYFDGSTSLEEEAKLKSYFRSEKVEDELKHYQPLFQFLDSEQVAGVSNDFDEKLFEKMDSEAKIVRIGNWRRNLLRVAAVGAVLLAAYLTFRPTPPAATATEIVWKNYEITDEKLALEETKKALLLLSAKLNKGKSKASEKVSKTEVTRYLN